MKQETKEAVKLCYPIIIGVLRALAVAAVCITFACIAYAVVKNIGDWLSSAFLHDDKKLLYFTWPQTTVVVTISICATVLILAMLQALFKCLTDD